MGVPPLHADAPIDRVSSEDGDGDQAAFLAQATVANRLRAAADEIQSRLCSTREGQEAVRTARPVQLAALTKACTSQALVEDLLRALVQVASNIQLRLRCGTINFIIMSLFPRICSSAAPVRRVQQARAPMVAL